MISTRSLLLAAALALPLPAYADLTPETLWQDWQDQAAAAGRDLSADVEQGAALTLRGLTVTRPLGTGTITATFDRMDLTQAGPGVKVSLPGDQQITVTANPAEGGPSVAVFSLGDGPLTALAEDASGAPTYTLSADTLTATLLSFTQDGEDVDADMRADLSGLGGTISGLSDGDAPLVADLTADAVASEVILRDPAMGGEVRNTATQQNVALHAELSGADSEWSLIARLENTDSASVSLQTSPEGSFETDSKQDTSRLALTLTDLRADYTAALTGMATTISGSVVPMGPLSLVMGAANMTLSVPTGPADGVQTARIALDLKDATMGDSIWAMLDPRNALPRDPGQLSLTAEADLEMIDGLSPTALPGDEPVPSLAPRAVRIENLALDLAGATLGGTGAFTIPEGPGGVPNIAQPIGSMDLQATGLAGLLQQAIAGGIVSAQQAMGAQMMLGMFAIQGEGDSFTSRIEAGPGSALFVNGNQLR